MISDHNISRNDIPCGLVLCGGASSRMGVDKSLLNYYGMEQRLYVGNLMNHFCSKVFVSQNKRQPPLKSKEFKSIIDDPEYAGHGPISGLLSAFKVGRSASFLVVGCDYPFMSSDELKRFVSSIPPLAVAAAFFNEPSSCYEPVLAWYSSEAGMLLQQYFSQGKHSLQGFLSHVDAYRYLPHDVRSIRSVDTIEDYQEITGQLPIKK